MDADGSWPSVGIVIPTHRRRMMLYAAVQSTRNQDYPGRFETLVVFDGSTPDQEMQDELTRLGARWIINHRQRGLPAARNAGTVELDHDLIAFCDDDDNWYPAKLRKQVTAWRADPDAEMMATAITVLDPRGIPHLRLVGSSRVEHEMLLRSRMAPLHSSTFLFRRASLLDMGMFDESAPKGHNEDWDILLRASLRGPVGVVDEPLVAAPWGSSSHFVHDYQGKIDSFDWILAKHPDLSADRKSRSRVLGQKAYWQACAGDSVARATAIEALQSDPLQPRAYLAILASTPLLSGPWLLSTLQRSGRGL